MRVRGGANSTGIYYWILSLFFYALDGAIQAGV